MEDSLSILEPLQWKITKPPTISAAGPECPSPSNTDLEYLTPDEVLKVKTKLSYVTNTRISKIFFCHLLRRASRGT